MFKYSGPTSLELLPFNAQLGNAQLHQEGVSDYINVQAMLMLFLAPSLCACVCVCVYFFFLLFGL